MPVGERAKVLPAAGKLLNIHSHRPGRNQTETSTVLSLDITLFGIYVRQEVLFVPVHHEKH